MDRNWIGSERLRAYRKRKCEEVFGCLYEKLFAGHVELDCGELGSRHVNLKIANNVVNIALAPFADSI